MEQSVNKELARLAYSIIKILNREKNIRPFTTTIHKLIYFLLALKRPKLLKKTYIPYFYGPFSRGVAYVLDALDLAGYLASERGPFGRQFRIKEEKDLPEENEAREVIDLFETLDSSLLGDTRRLAELAKVHWVVTRYPDLSPEEIVREADKLGWKLSTEAVEEHLKILENARLYLSRG